ncbi:uncharacterized protein LOC128236150 [Mya arenaria]|uniref:uncharacterized protein LOC128236150 n=1 Tax=Mya arenaria TaxID=6604 RepID=UPI0022E821E7|nr:uncharacterized protein LOC128236150 [Mya arenaria]
MEFVVNGHFGTGADELLDELYSMSVRVSEVLDQLGYSESMVRYRCEATERLDRLLNRHRTDYLGITIGSKQEGYCCPFESDRDVMFIHETVVCRLQEDGTSSLPDTLTEFIMDNEYCNPGYYRLELIRKAKEEDSNLVVNIISCVKVLQQSIRDNFLPYYMIPDRNLLRGRINLTQRHHLIAKLDMLIQEGPLVIMRCPKVRLALQMPSAELIKQGRWRDKLEKLWVEMWNMWWAYCLPGIEVEEMFRQAGRSHSFINVWQEMNDLVWPQWRLYQGQDFPTIYRRKILIALK